MRPAGSGPGPGTIGPQATHIRRCRWSARSGAPAPPSATSERRNQDSKIPRGTVMDTTQFGTSTISLRAVAGSTKPRSDHGAAIESLPHRRRAATLTRYREPARRSLRRQHLKGELHDRTDGDSYDGRGRLHPPRPTSSTRMLCGRGSGGSWPPARFTASLAPVDTPAPLAGGPEPCVVCFDTADTTYEEPASKFTVAAHAEPCGRMWIEEALEAHE